MHKFYATLFVLLTVVTSGVLSGCTPAIKEAFRKEQQNIKNYDANPVLALSGFTTLFPVASDKTEKEIKRVCLTDGQPRVASFSGASDPIYYSQCPYTPYFPEDLGLKSINRN